MELHQCSSLDVHHREYEEIEEVLEQEKKMEKKTMNEEKIMSEEDGKMSKQGRRWHEEEDDLKFSISLKVELVDDVSLEPKLDCREYQSSGLALQ